MSRISENLMKVDVVENDNEKVTLRCVLKKEVFFEMFETYDFQRTMESRIAERIVEDLPQPMLDKLTKMIDYEAVAKLISLKLIQQHPASNR